ncbi:MAG: alkaline phosphatase family protein [Terriglobales bacterium]
MKSALQSSDVCTKSRKFKPLLLLLLLSLSVTSMAQTRLVTGKSITYPPLGTQLNVGSLPMNIVLTPDGKHALVSDMGFEESLTVVNAQTGQFVSNVDYPNCNYCYYQNTNGLYYGIAFGSNGTVYAAQGGNNSIDVLFLGNDGVLADLGPFTATQGTDFPSGLATDNRGYLYVANNDPIPTETEPLPFLVPGSVAIYSQASQSEVGRFSFAASYFGTPNFPQSLAVLSDGSKTYVASERDGAVYVLNTSDPTNPTLSSTIPTGQHPNALLFNAAQSLLYVGNASSDTVSVVSTATDTVLNTVLIRPSGLTKVAGTSSPTGLALTPDGSTLLVSLADLNAVAALTVNGSNLTAEGYIPAGWYPSGVVAPTNNSVLFTNAKGTTPFYPSTGYIQWDFNSSPWYDQHLIEGNVSFITGLKDEKKLATWTAEVVKNNAITSGHNVEALGLKPGAIKHVIYIVKENRTYDQVLGDIPSGNGDSSLALFGQTITPNQHALAQRFALLDNAYTISEVSYDGWSWSTQAFGNEDLIKSAPYDYSGRGRQYDSEGQNNGYNVGGFPANNPDGQQISPLYYPTGAPPIPDIVRAPGGRIWEGAQAAGISYRNYGFLLAFGVSDSNGNVIMPDNYPALVSNQPPGHDLAGVTDWDFREFDNDYPDSDASTMYTQQGVQGCSYPETGYGKYSSPSRFSEFLREFKEMLKNDPTGNSVPAFITLRFPHDHTQGPTSGDFTPAAEVADNDYAMGELVDAISHSPIWTSTAIFSIEDDSQDGPDHVDCHRTTAYVVSPWIKQSSVDHTFYNTASMLKTIEIILGLPPLTSYDATATPISDWNTQPSNNAPYTATLPSQETICSQTPKLETLSRKDPRRAMIVQAGALDTRHPDSAPDRILNDLIWKSVKGPDSAPPAPRHAVGATKDSDDD